MVLLSSYYFSFSDFNVKIGFSDGCKKNRVVIFLISLIKDEMNSGSGALLRNNKHRTCRPFLQDYLLF